eukprot:5100463-Amphidinium_carterae.1
MEPSGLSTLRPSFEYSSFSSSQPRTLGVGARFQVWQASPPMSPGREKGHELQCPTQGPVLPARANALHKALYFPHVLVICLTQRLHCMLWHSAEAHQVEVTLATVLCSAH